MSVCRDILDLHAIQTDIAQLVNEQGDDIDQIGKFVQRPASIYCMCVRVCRGENGTSPRSCGAWQGSD